MSVEGGRPDLQPLCSFGHGDLQILQWQSSAEIKRNWRSDSIEPTDALSSGAHFYLALNYAA